MRTLTKNSNAAYQLEAMEGHRESSGRVFVLYTYVFTTSMTTSVNNSHSIFGANNATTDNMSKYLVHLTIT